MKRLLLAAALLSITAIPASAQIGNALKDKLLKKGLPTVDQIVQGKPPITTSLTDAQFASDVPNTSLNKNTKASSLMTLQRTPNGGFVLQPGYFEMHTQSYCLKAGTHGPGGG